MTTGNRSIKARKEYLKNVKRKTAKKNISIFVTFLKGKGKDLLVGVRFARKIDQLFYIELAITKPISILKIPVTEKFLLLENC